VGDYRTLREGDIDPEFGKRIEYIVYADRDYIVFLDSDARTLWSFNDTRYGTLCEGAGTILNRVSALAYMPTDALTRKQLGTFNKLIAGAIARLLGDRSITQAAQALDAAERWLSARNNEVARVWYLSASSVVALPLLAIGVGVYVWRTALAQVVGLNGTDFVLGSCAGAAGAWLSVATRLGQASLDVSAGRTPYYYEGASKIAIGVLGAALVAAAVKANLLLGALADTQHPRALLVLLCIVSGASERIVPNLVGRVEEMFPNGDSRVKKAASA